MAALCAFGVTSEEALPAGGLIVARPVALHSYAPGLRRGEDLRASIPDALAPVRVPAAAPGARRVLEEAKPPAATARRACVSTRLAHHHAPHLIDALRVRELHACLFHPLAVLPERGGGACLPGNGTFSLWRGLLLRGRFGRRLWLRLRLF